MTQERQGIVHSRAALVRDAMQALVVGVVPEMTVRELIPVLLENDISGAPVLDSRGRAIGVVSMTDIMRLAAHEAEVPSGQLVWEPTLTVEEQSGSEAAREQAEVVRYTVPPATAMSEASFDQYHVRDIMTPVAFSVRPTDTLGSASRFMLQGRIHRALVVDEGVLLGIITPFDLLQALDWT